MSLPVMVCYGGGVNSTAMLVGLALHGERPDLIIFSDPGGERPETYEYLAVMDGWLSARDWPSITRVRHSSPEHGAETLEANCLREQFLPSLAYGFKGCSGKFKREPQDEFVAAWPPALAAWESGGVVEKLVGFDADEIHRGNAKQRNKRRYRTRYPLRDWDWGRRECIDAVERAGLPVPPKSSCFFCPATRSPDIVALGRRHPDLLERALAIERAGMANATPGGSTIGLSRGRSWAAVVKADAAQARLFDLAAADIPCDCYDGDDDD
mgnify:CR=1 FL=1